MGKSRPRSISISANQVREFGSSQSLWPLDQSDCWKLFVQLWNYTKRQCTLRVIKRTSFFVKTKFKGNVENQKIEFWHLESNRLWNPESTDVESGIHGCGIRNPQRGIRNPRLSWITLHGATVGRPRSSVYCFVQHRPSPLKLFSGCESIRFWLEKSCCFSTKRLRFVGCWFSFTLRWNDRV